MRATIALALIVALAAAIVLPAGCGGPRADDKKKDDKSKGAPVPPVARADDKKKDDKSEEAPVTPVARADDKKKDDKSEGAPVPPEARVPPEAVYGLKVEFYDFPQWIPKGVDSLKDAKDFLANNKPTLTYTLKTRSISFPHDDERTANSDKVSLGEYLLGKKEFDRRKEDAQGSEEKFPKRLGQPINQRSIFIFTGFIKVDKAGTYWVKVPVDDGSEVQVGGVVVQSKPTLGGMTGPDDPAYAGKMTFFEPGIYPIKVLHWDREQELGIHLYSDLDARGEMKGKRVLLPII